MACRPSGTVMLFDWNIQNWNTSHRCQQRIWKRRGADFIRTEVFPQNIDGMRFYERNGFYEMMKTIESKCKPFGIGIFVGVSLCPRFLFIFGYKKLKQKTNHPTSLPFFILSFNSYKAVLSRSKYNFSLASL